MKRANLPQAFPFKLDTTGIDIPEGKLVYKKSVEKFLLTYLCFVGPMKIIKPTISNPRAKYLRKYLHNNKNNNKFK